MIGVYLIDAKKYSVKGDRKKARYNVLIQKLSVIIKDYAYYLKKYYILAHLPSSSHFTYKKITVNED